MSDADVLPLDESYALLRSAVVGQVVDCDVVVLTGKDAIAYLQGQCSQDVAALGLGGSAETLVLTPQGRLDAYARVAVLGEEHVVVAVASGFGDALYERLRRFKIRVKTDLTLETWRCVQLRGPHAQKVAPGDAVLAIAASWPGLDGVDLLGRDAALPAGVPAGDPRAFAAARIECGEPVMGHEVTERTIAHETGLVGRTVSFTKGCYLGQELVARIDARGANVPKRLLGLVVPGGSPDTGPAVDPGATVTVGGRDAGEVTSAAWSPGCAATVALAYVKRAFSPPAAAELGAGAVPAEIVELPIVA